MRLEAIDGSNWQAFLGAPWSVLMLGKSDCERCAEFTEELDAFLAVDRAYGDVRFGKMLLDRGGLAAFKRANPWLVDLDVLPYTVIYRAGEKVAEFAGGGIARLAARLERVGAAALEPVPPTPRIAGTRGAAPRGREGPVMDRRFETRSILALGLLVAGLVLMGPGLAAAHVVEVTTSLSMEQVQDTAQLKQALRAEVDRVLNTAIAFKPTVVALTDARQVGQRLLVRLLIADAEGEALIKELESDGGGEMPASVDPMQPRDLRI